AGIRWRRRRPNRRAEWLPLDRGGRVRPEGHRPARQTLRGCPPGGGRLSLMGLASRVLRIQPGEGRIAGLVVGLAFVAMTSFTLGESAVDALFFDRVGAQALPVTYMLQGTASFAVMLVLTGTLGR